MPDMILLETEENMEDRLNGLLKELAKVRTGRANPKMLDNIKVDYYGAMTLIKQIGNVTVPEPSQLLFKPYDKSINKEVAKAINAANLGVNPSNEGDQIRISIPALTTERRKEFTKLAKKLGEEAKVAMRNARRDGNDAIKKLEKASEVSEDDSKIYLEDIQVLTDKFITTIDQMVKEKEEDIMSI